MEINISFPLPGLGHCVCSLGWSRGGGRRGRNDLFMTASQQRWYQDEMDRKGNRP